MTTLSGVAMGIIPALNRAVKRQNRPDRQALRGLRRGSFDYFCSTEPEPKMDVESFGDPTYSTVPDPVTVASSSSLAFTTTSPEPVTPTFARLVCSSAASTEPLPDIATVKRS